MWLLHNRTSSSSSFSSTFFFPTSLVIFSRAVVTTLFIVYYAEADNFNAPQQQQQPKEVFPFTTFAFLSFSTSVSSPASSTTTQLPDDGDLGDESLSHKSRGIMAQRFVFDLERFYAPFNFSITVGGGIGDDAAEEAELENSYTNLGWVLTVSASICTDDDDDEGGWMGRHLMNLTNPWLVDYQSVEVLPRTLLPDDLHCTYNFSQPRVFITLSLESGAMGLLPLLRNLTGTIAVRPARHVESNLPMARSWVAGEEISLDGRQHAEYSLYEVILPRDAMPVANGTSPATYYNQLLSTSIEVSNLYKEIFKVQEGGEGEEEPMLPDGNLSLELSFGVRKGYIQVWLASRSPACIASLHPKAKRLNHVLFNAYNDSEETQDSGFNNNNSNNSSSVDGLGENGSSIFHPLMFRWKDLMPGSRVRLSLDANVLEEFRRMEQAQCDSAGKNPLPPRPLSKIRDGVGEEEVEALLYAAAAAAENEGSGNLLHLPPSLVVVNSQPKGHYCVFSVAATLYSPQRLEAEQSPILPTTSTSVKFLPFSLGAPALVTIIAIAATVVIVIGLFTAVGLYYCWSVIISRRTNNYQLNNVHPIPNRPSISSSSASAAARRRRKPAMMPYLRRRSFMGPHPEIGKRDGNGAFRMASYYRPASCTDPTAPNLTETSFDHQSRGQFRERHSEAGHVIPQMEGAKQANTVASGNQRSRLPQLGVGVRRMAMVKEGNSSDNCNLPRRNVTVWTTKIL